MFAHSEAEVRRGYNASSAEVNEGVNILINRIRVSSVGGDISGISASSSCSWSSPSPSSGCPPNSAVLAVRRSSRSCVTYR